MNPKYRPLDSWLKDCEICNVGLCKRIDELKEEGNSTREAARIMDSESDGLWEADKIRNRYRYYKQGRGGSKRPAKNTNQNPSTQPVKESEMVSPEVDLTDDPVIDLEIDPKDSEKIIYLQKKGMPLSPLGEKILDNFYKLEALVRKARDRKDISFQLVRGRLVPIWEAMESSKRKRKLKEFDVALQGAITSFIQQQKVNDKMLKKDAHCHFWQINNGEAELEVSFLIRKFSVVVEKR